MGEIFPHHSQEVFTSNLQVRRFDTMSCCQDVTFVDQRPATTERNCVWNKKRTAKSAHPCANSSTCLLTIDTVPQNRHPRILEQLRDVAVDDSVQGDGHAALLRQQVDVGMLAYVTGTVRGDVDLPWRTAHLGPAVFVPAHVRGEGVGDGPGQRVLVLGDVVQHWLAAVDAEAEPSCAKRGRARLPQDVLLCDGKERVLVTRQM